MEYIILIVGFLILIKGADFFVDGSSSIAKKFNVPPILIGLTIVAFGTSSPEGAVSINAAIKNVDQITVGNIIGSSIFNILLVIGMAAVIKPVKIQHKTILKEFPFLLLTCIVFFILSADIILNGSSVNILTKADGLILLSIFSIFMYYIVEMAILSKEESDEEIKDMPITKSLIMGGIGLIGIIFGGNLVVDSSSTIALNLGMSETLVGLTIVAIGTSLPELMTSVVAAFKGESDIAVGNAIGSNVFNILLILGITSLVRPIGVESKVFFDMLFLLGATILTYVFVTTKRETSRFEGVIMSVAYIGYMIYVIFRN